MNKIFHLKITNFLLIISILIIYNCNIKKINISYIDGNGNIYNININNKTLEYKPIKPQLSSSGIYNGGNYSKVKLTDKQYNEIKSYINNATKKKSIHIKNKIKRSGVIIIQKNEIKKTYILKPETKEQLEIEKILKKFIIGN